MSKTSANHLILGFLFLAVAVVRGQQPGFLTSTNGPTSSSETNGFGFNKPKYGTNRGTVASPVQAKPSEQTKHEAEQREIEADYTMGCIYLDGWSGIIPKNANAAIRSFTKAAEKGYIQAQRKLAYLYFKGDEVGQDYKEATKWYRKVAEQGDSEAQNFLGMIYERGMGVSKDYAEAVSWHGRSAKQGDANGQCSLGFMYELGQGVPQDFVEAYKWFNLSAAKGDRDAIKGRDELSKVMNSEQIAEAQRLARQFVPRKEPTGSKSDSSISAGCPKTFGTGFFITGDGYLISSYHVVKGALRVELLTSVGKINAKVVQTDAANDLALLEVQTQNPFEALDFVKALPISPSRPVKLGSTVATVGFPDPGLQGFSPKLGKGEIAALAGAEDDARYFQISVPVQPGNSGGALVDSRGNVVGIVSAKLNAAAALASSGALPENVNYAVKSSFLLSFLESVPDVSAKLKEPLAAERKFEDVVKSAQDAAVLVLVY
ncbi:MAG: tetratricopeptide repeat-containing serine protease family protein [Verrucomicrobia bacterium]|nr:tetratricopeptide repeat-containing serine protease family protein [Verrucomicrobiota bacterium]